MSWKNLMKNYTLFLYSSTHTDSLFLIWRLPLGNMIKTLSDLGINLKSTNPTKKRFYWKYKSYTTIWVDLNVNALKQIE